MRRFCAQKALPSWRARSRAFHSPASINTGAHLKYERDFGLGDRVTCLNRRWGVTIDARITEVSEQFEGGKNELQITFGTSLPTLNDQLKWR